MERVEDLMIREVPVLSRLSDLRELEELMERHRLPVIPIVDEAGRIVGVAGRAELVAWYREHEAHGRSGGGRGRRDPVRSPAGVKVQEAMSPVIHCIGPRKPLVEAAARMIREHAPRLIVVDEGYAVVGVLDAVDVLRAIPGVRNLLRESEAVPAD